MTTIKTATREDLRGKHLTRVHGRQPNANDVETWEEEAAEIASAIKVKSRFILGGEIHGILAMVIPEDEYRLEIEDMDFEYEEPQRPEPYNPDITGGDDEHSQKVLEAEYSEVKDDYQCYLGARDHLVQEFIDSMDATWMAPLKRPQSGFMHLTVKQINAHHCNIVAKLTNKQKMEMRQDIERMELPNGKYQRVFHQDGELAIKIRTLAHHGQNA
jgi:hypothetical protein